MSEILSNNTEEKWEEIKSHPFYAEELAALVKEGEEYLVTPVPATPYTAYMRFRKDGNRLEYETPYFVRRRRIAVLTILVKLYGEKYLPALLDVIWAVTEEFTWCVPAHLPLEWYHEKGYLTSIDLYATETGALLAETDHILGDTLPSYTREHIRAEVEKRVMRPYIDGVGSPWWMDGVHNWGAVCTCNVALCFLYLGTERDVYRLEPQFNRTMNLFLASYGSDGCCAEGLSYWCYGFGLFLIYADAMRNYSETHRLVTVNEARAAFVAKEQAHDPLTGRIDYFVREDVRRAVAFASNMRLTGEHGVSFSDGLRVFSYPRSLFWLLKREYPDEIAYPPLGLVKPTISAGGLTLSRYFLWSDPNAEYGEKLKPCTVIYPETSWFIKKTARYSLAAKAGHNAEPHNHNDVGSFHLVTENGEAFVDLGAGEYVRQYFLADYRYGFLTNRSRGHSLPIINGSEQVVTKEKAPVLVMEENAFAFDMAKAYAMPTLLSAVRRFDTDEDGFVLTDRFSFSEMPETLIERFVSADKPVAAEGCVMVGDFCLRFDPEVLDVAFHEEEYVDHIHKPKTAYFTDLTVKEKAKEIALAFRFDLMKGDMVNDGDE